MGVEVKNLAFLRTADPTSRDFPIKLAEALQDLAQQVSNGQQQVNANPSGQPDPPPPINGVNVTARDGHLSVAIQDHNPIYRGISYWVEHADNPQFTNPQVIELGGGRNIDIPVGSQTRYVRAYSSYGSSHPSEPAYHGSSVEPIPVAGGGSGPGPAFLPSQGSGTGAPGVGLQGPGRAPFRPVEGKPPVR